MTSDQKTLEQNILVATRVYSLLSSAHILLRFFGADELPRDTAASLGPDWDYDLRLVKERSGFDLSVMETDQNWVKNGDLSTAHVCLLMQIEFPSVIMDIFWSHADHQFLSGIDFTISGRIHFSDCYCAYDGVQFYSCSEH
jgi:hypothetical protein